MASQDSLKISVTTSEGQTGNMKFSVKMEIMVSLTLTVRFSLQKLEQAAAFPQQTSPTALSQSVLWCPHDVADKFFHTYNFKKGKITTSFQLPRFNFFYKKTPF